MLFRSNDTATTEIYTTEDTFPYTTLFRSIREADPGSAGWMTPAEPLLHPADHPAAWAHALAILRHRAA